MTGQAKSQDIRQRVFFMAETTSMHGPSNIYRSTGLLRRIVWSAVFLAGFCILVYQVVESFKTYYRYPVDTKIEIERDFIQIFPAVTICNLNPMRSTSLDDDFDFLNEDEEDFDDDDYHDYKDEEDEEDDDYNDDAGSPAENNTYLGDDEDYTYTGSGTEPDQYDYNESPCGGMPCREEDLELATENSFFQTDTEQYLKRSNFTNAFISLPLERRIEVGHNLKTMLLGCSWQGKKCAPRNFTTFNNFLYGNCFSFNTGGEENSTVKTVTKVGPLYGLELELYVEQAEYIEALSDAAGIRVVIHNQTHMPFPEDEGFSISPGSLTYVGLKRVVQQGLPPPHGRCQTGNTPEALETNAWAGLWDTLSYSTQACQRTCYQKHVIKECGCGDHLYILNSTAFLSVANSTDVPPCNNGTEVTNQTECQDKVFKNYTSTGLDCPGQCPPECLQVRYDKSISYALWPSDVKEASLISKLEEHSFELWNALTSLYYDDERTMFVRGNVLKLVVYMESLDYESIKIQAAYSVTSLLSALGGQLGLWLGLSVVTLCEFVELVYDILLLCLTRAGVMNQHPATPPPRDVEMQRKMSADYPPISRQNSFVSNIIQVQPA